MLDELHVSDIYITIENYPNISQDAPIGHAIYMMHHVLEDKHKFRSILVLDDDDHLKGYLSLKDLIRAVGPDYLHKKRPDVKGNQPFNFEGLNQDLSALSLIWQEGFSLKLHEELHKPVADYLTLIEDQVRLDDPIAKCLYIMLFRDVLILPVVEEECVIGVVRLVDLFDCIADNVEKVWLPDRESV
ncbi:MAG: CBS domain-containing protein [Gammaproteobacteria bacterium]|nr:CBS domain-containing protein [Gammaproteobacteria bacterium]